MNNLLIFEGKKVRKTWHDEEWWFVVTDVIFILTESIDPDSYIKNIRKRDKELSKQWVTITKALLVETKGGKQKTICASRQGIFRIIQSVRSVKAEPFKQWLAKVGHERILENENPELGFNRLRAVYKAKGYDEKWIETRIKGIHTRENLTNEWQQRGIKKQLQYAILTAEISKQTFGMTPSQYRKYKDLAKQNLRDHMTRIELIFSDLGEEATILEAKDKDAQGFRENKKAAKNGGKYAGAARKAFEEARGQKVSTKHNFLNQIKEATRLSLFSTKKEEEE